MASPAPKIPGSHRGHRRSGTGGTGAATARLSCKPPCKEQSAAEPPLRRNSLNSRKVGNCRVSRRRERGDTDAWPVLPAQHAPRKGRDRPSPRHPRRPGVHPAEHRRPGIAANERRGAHLHRFPSQMRRPRPQPGHLRLPPPSRAAAPPEVDNPRQHNRFAPAPDQRINFCFRSVTTACTDARKRSITRESMAPMVPTRKVPSAFILPA